MSNYFHHLLNIFKLPSVDDGLVGSGKNYHGLVGVGAKILVGLGSGLSLKKVADVQL